MLTNKAIIRTRASVVGLFKRSGRTANGRVGSGQPRSALHCNTFVIGYSFWHSLSTTEGLVDTSRLRRTLLCYRKGGQEVGMTKPY